MLIKNTIQKIDLPLDVLLKKNLGRKVGKS